MTRWWVSASLNFMSFWNLVHRWNQRIASEGVARKKWIQISLRVVASVYLFWMAYAWSDRFDAEVFSAGSFYPCAAIAFLSCFVMTLFNAWRWQVLTRKYAKVELPFSWWFTKHWISQAVGIFLFGIIGADVYRGMQMKKKLNMEILGIEKTILEDRLWSFGSLCGLVLMFFVCETFGIGVFVIVLCGLFFLKRSVQFLIFTSAFPQAIKIASVSGILMVLGAQWEGVEHFAYVAAVGLLEFAPISFNGFGIGHMGFYFINPKIGFSAYNYYFVGKIIFKGLAVFLLLLAGFRKKRDDRSTVTLLKLDHWATARALRFILKTQLEKDSSPARTLLFESRLKASPWLVRRAYRIFRREPWASWVCLFFGYFESPEFTTAQKNLPLALETHRNDSLIFDKFERMFIELQIRRWKAGGKILTKVFLLTAFPYQLIANWQQARRLRRIFVRLGQQYPFYALLRVSQAVFIFKKLMIVVQKKCPSLLLISSEGNPAGIAALATSQRTGLFVMYISHAPFVANPAQLNCDVGVFWGEQSLKDFQEKDSRIQRSFLMGFRDLLNNKNYSRRSICICLSKDVNLNSLSELIEHLHRIGEGHQIRLRLHPNSFRPKTYFKHHFGNRAHISDGSLDEDIRSARLTIAGNSSVHLESSIRGVKSLYFKDLESTPKQPFTFLTAGVIAELTTLEELGSFLEGLPGGAPTEWAAKYFNTTQTFETFEKQLTDYLKHRLSSIVERIPFYKG